MGYITKFSPEQIDNHLDFTSTTSWSIDALIPAVDVVSTENGVLLGSLSPAVSISSVGIQTVVYNSQYITRGGMQNFTLIGGDTLNVVPELTCSTNSSTTISYIKADCVGSTAPTWTTVASSTGLLSVIAPIVTVDTEFWLFINSFVNGATTIQKMIKINVIHWAPSNCQKWLDTGGTVWSIWNPGYNLNSGSWIGTSSSGSNSSNASSSENNSLTKETAQILSTSTQSVIGATVVVVTFSSMMNTSSMASLWSMINQVQMFLLLILTRAYIPDDVQSAITGWSFALNPGDYIPFHKLHLIGSFISNFDFELNNPQLESIGLKSESTIYNINSSVLTLLIVIILHVFIFIFSKLIFMCCKRNTWCLVRLFRILISKCLSMLTFSYYIRFFLELNQILLISSINEIYQFKTSPNLRIVSLVAAFIILAIWIFIAGLVIYLTIINYKAEADKCLHEFFTGLKSDRK